MKTRFFASVLLLSWFSIQPLAVEAAQIPAPDDQEEAAVVSNGDGYFVVWADKRNFGSADYDIYGTRVSATGEVLDPGGIAICRNPGRQTSPRVAFDGNEYMVIWEDDRESTSTFLIYQIYGARVTRDGRVLDPDGFKVTTNRIDRTGPAVASNGNGFFAVWVDWHRTEGAIADIYGSPISSDGQVAFPDGLPLVTAPLWQMDPRIAALNGEFLVTCVDMGDITALRLAGDGTKLSAPFAVSTSHQAEDRYGLAANGRDYFVAYADSRGSPSGFAYPKIYGTLIRSNGVVVNPSGIQIGTSALYQERPRVAADGNGFLVVWQESRDEHAEFPDIYAARVGGDGATDSSGKFPVSALPGAQRNPDVAAGGPGGALAVWQDRRMVPTQSYPWGAVDIYGALINGTNASPADGILISDLHINQPPSISIAYPTNGSIFLDPAYVFFLADVFDPDGPSVSAKVQFFDGDKLLGNGLLTDPGPLHESIFRFIWTNPPPGSYTITARVTDVEGATGTSEAIKIRIGRPIPPVVTIRANDGSASESGDSGQFTISREGSTDDYLSVFYTVGGTASNGIDYAEILRWVTLPVGAGSATVKVAPIDDSIVEGTETVILKLVESPVLSPIGSGYTIGFPSNAVVEIRDNDPVTNHPPEVRLISPQEGGTFPARSDIRLSAGAFDPDSDSISVEFFEGTNSLGIARFSPTRCPGQFCPDYSLVWSNVPPGRYSIVAVATDKRGATGISIPAHIVVGDSALPLVWVETDPAQDPQAREFCPPNLTCLTPSFIVRRSGPTNNSLRVYLGYTGTATRGTDYQSLPESVEIPAGSDAAWLPVKPIDDQLFEGPETVILTIRPPLTANLNYVIDEKRKSATITIQDNEGPVLRIDASSPVAEENSGPLDRLRKVGVFTISRTGPTNTSMMIFVNYSGTATYGVDYPELARLVTIPAGARSTEVRVEATDDGVPEEIETVIATLSACGPVTDPPGGIICIDFPTFDSEHSSATIRIVDSPLEGASLVITQPLDGQSFPSGSVISIEARAIDLAGYIPRVEFWDGEVQIGVSEIDFIRAPDPGTPIMHHFEWSGALPGEHVLTARAVRSDGTKLISPPVHIKVSSPPPRELHVVAGYSGTGPDGGLSHTNEPTDAAVRVDRPGKQVTLILSAYEPVRWHLTVTPGTVLERIIVGGYYHQSVEGQDSGVPILNLSPPDSLNYLYIGYSLVCPDFYRALPRIHALTGMEISSFHGSYQLPYPNPTLVDGVQDDPRILTNYPEVTPPSQLPDLRFTLSLFQRGTGTNIYSRGYSLQGADDGGKLLPAFRVIPDLSNRYFYGLDWHQPFQIDAQTGIERNLTPQPGLGDFSWPFGMTFDPQRNRVLVVTFGGVGNLFAFAPPTGPWSVVRSMDNMDVENLVYHAATDSLFAMTLPSECSSPSIQKFTPDGQFQSGFRLDLQAYGYTLGAFQSELISVGDYLVLFLEPSFGSTQPESRIYLIDPRTGQSWLTYRSTRPPVNTPPTVEITWPANGTSFPAGSTNRLAAMAVDGDGSVVNVEFFANGSSLGFAQHSSENNSLFTLDWVGVQPGPVTLTAQATDNRGARGFSVPVQITIVGESNQAPRITIVRPVSGAEFSVGAPIEILAEGIDPDGVIRKVEFFADGAKIGEAGIDTPGVPVRDRQQSFTFVWRLAAPGPHRLVVYAVDNDGGTAQSGAVEIRVTVPDQVPFVNVIARDAFASEPRSNSVVNTATFRLRRFGATNEPLTVAYALDGTAQNGVDYAALSGWATIPAGQKYVDVTVVPLADDLDERYETVRIRLLSSTNGSGVYRIGIPSRAVAIISDKPLERPPGGRSYFVTDGLLNICVAVEGSAHYRVEASSDLRTWETIGESVACEGALHFIDQETGQQPSRFYRLVADPLAVDD